jgi:hypothetical protein
VTANCIRILAYHILLSNIFAQRADMGDFDVIQGMQILYNHYQANDKMHVKI